MAEMTNINTALNKVLAKEIMGWSGERDEGGVEVWNMGNGKYIAMEVWNPVGDIYHAMNVLEKLRRANGGDYSIIITDLGDYWHVTLGDEHREPVHLSGFSTSLEWAICRAALRHLEKNYGG